MAAIPYEEKKQRLVDVLSKASGSVRLGKDTSNLFRDRKNLAVRSLDVRDFNNVLHVDPKAGYIEV